MTRHITRKQMTRFEKYECWNQTETIVRPASQQYHTVVKSKATKKGKSETRITANVIKQNYKWLSFSSNFSSFFTV